MTTEVRGVWPRLTAHCAEDLPCHPSGVTAAGSGPDCGDLGSRADPRAHIPGGQHAAARRRWREGGSGMRVLIAHNRYRSSLPSGENRVVAGEIELLSSAGVDVVPMLPSSDVLLNASRRRMAIAGLGSVYSHGSASDFRDILQRSKPDVVHVHNVFPIISPWVIRVAAQNGIPVVQTVHNFRHSCLNGIHFREGSACTSCLGKSVPIAAIRNSCYRDSRVQTISMAAGQVAHRGTWRSVSRFLALTPFMRSLLVAHGLPRERVAVRPAWVPDTGYVERRGRDFLFVGRLDEAKGVSLLLDAWNRVSEKQGRALRIAGDGPLAERVRAAASRSRDLIYLGPLDKDQIATEMAEAACLVAPSLCFEGYGLVLAEAFARGRCVVTVSGGAMATIVGDEFGWVSAPGVAALAETMSRITDGDAHAKGLAARRNYEESNSPEAALTSLLRTYCSVQADRVRALEPEGR